jgi:hypothetical protein
MIIDCAKNGTLAKEIIDYLRLHEYEVHNVGNEIITVDKSARTILNSFLQETGRYKHKVIQCDSETVLIAIPTDLQDIGLESCEFCGYIDHPEGLEVHRRTHQAL